MSIILQGVFSKMRDKARVPTFITSIQHRIGSFSQSSQARSNKRHLNWKRRSKIMFADDITLYVENLKIPPKKSERTNEFSKASRIRIQSQYTKISCISEIPWWSSGQHSALSLLRVWVQSLVRELRSCKPCCVAKNKSVTVLYTNNKYLKRKL